VEGQLLSELGACHLLLGELDRAEDCYCESLQLAKQHRNPAGLIFARLGLCRVALGQEPKKIEEAQHQLQQSLKELGATSELPGSLKNELQALAQELDGDIQLARGDTDQAIAAYSTARTRVEFASRCVPANT